MEKLLYIMHALKVILKLITNNVGLAESEWMASIAMYSQQIIINTSEEILKDPLLPLVEKVRKRVENMYQKEESLKGYLKAAADDSELRLIQTIHRMVEAKSIKLVPSNHQVNRLSCVAFNAY